MIVPMKKIAILVQAKDATSCLEALRRLGLVHIEHQRLPQGEDISALREKIALINDVLIVLSQEEFISPAERKTDQGLTEWESSAQHILELRNRFNQLKSYAITLETGISQWQRWGDFDPDSLRSLSAQGICAGLYQIPSREIKHLAPTLVVKEISRSHGIVNCLVLAREKINLQFRQVVLPAMGLKAMQKRLTEDKRAIEAIKEQVRRCLSLRKSFMRIKEAVKKDVEFQEALNGMGQAGTLSYLTGYIPEQAARIVQQEARKQKWGIMISTPAPDDPVPTLIRNPRWISIIRPVFKLIEIVPGYKELDISLWFLIFFSIFFGMLIGDAGIGLIFLGLTYLAQKKWSRHFQEQSLFILFYLLSFCSVIWGALSGTFFGQSWLTPYLKPIMPALRNDKNVQTLCFLLGAAHLSIAHGWRALLKLPSIKAWAEIGWMSILWGAFFLAKMLVLGDSFPSWAKWLFIFGAASIVLFTHPSKNVLKGLGEGIGNLLLNLVNSFTDIVSYVRLFAVGLATVAVADSFNQMAMEVGFTGIIPGLISCVILLVGHSLNMILAPMSILVHGVRLNVLEFCTHLDIKWSGFAYQPLREEKTR